MIVERVIDVGVVLSAQVLNAEDRQQSLLSRFKEVFKERCDMIPGEEQAEVRPMYHPETGLIVTTQIPIQGGTAFKLISYACFPPLQTDPPIKDVFSGLVKPGVYAFRFQQFSPFYTGSVTQIHNLRDHIKSSVN